jgi:hypothetical protein
MIGEIISFLRNVMTETLAKRIVSLVLIVVGAPNERVTELTGLCDRSVRELRKKINLLALKSQTSLRRGIL